MKLAMHYALRLVIPVVILGHLFLSPYTKVEESFNIQAIHDIIKFGIPLSDSAKRLTLEYDHVTFPGSVPRSFVGALALASLSKPFAGLCPSSEHVQLLVRGILGMINAACLLAYERAVSQAFGMTAGVWYILFQASQFHVMYYASRTLPNMFAFALTTLALRYAMLSNFGSRRRRAWRCRLALGLVTFAGVTLRSELAILVATMTLTYVLIHRVSLRNVILPAGIATALIGLLTTVLVDSFFWQRFPLWPEWVAFRYNTIEGKSADWGVSPWHHYFSSSLPKLMMNPLTLLVCIPTAVGIKATRKFSVDGLIPLLAYACLYSFLPHKEWRFIIYIIPGLTAVASAGASWIWIRRTKSWLYMALSVALVLSVLGSAAASLGLLALSSLNYPGAQALLRLQELVTDAPFVEVYLDNLSCQTGVTRFLEESAMTANNDVIQHTIWHFDKTEDEFMLAEPAFWQRFDYVLAEDPLQIPGDWDIIDEIEAYAGISLQEGRSFFAVLLPASLQHGPVKGALRIVEHFEDTLKRHLTRGLWPLVRTEPKIHILRRPSDL